MDIDSTNPKRLRIRNPREKLSIIYYFYTIYIICIQTHNIGEETCIDITKNPFRIADILPRQSSMGTKYIRQRWYQTLGHQCVLWRIDGVLGHI